MTTLKVHANERIDFEDFGFSVTENLDAIARRSGEAFFGNNGSWVLEGFALTNPTGKQLQVSNGRAILAARADGAVQYGYLLAEGDLTKVIDLAALPSGTYNAYIRFELLDGDNSSRVFWNPTGNGAEFVQTVATRRRANWSLRVETSNPGAEWLQIGTANNAGASLVIVDQRPLYFEGQPSATYASGWGTANDRNPDRITYGTKDLHTFTAAIRQCLEDLKGRGLRRWWDAGIGGLNVGFDADPVEDRVAAGDANFSLFFNAGTPRLVGSANGTYVQFNRNANPLLESGYLFAGSQQSLKWDQYGVQIAQGLSIGKALVGDQNFGLLFNALSLTPKMAFDSSSYFQFDRTLKNFSWYIDGGFEAGLSALNGFYVGDSNFKLSYEDGNVPSLFFDSLARMQYNRASAYFQWLGSTGVSRMLLSDAGLRVLQGLNVGFNSTPVDDTLAVGDSNFRLYFNSGAPELIFDSNLVFHTIRGSDPELDLYIFGNRIQRSKMNGANAYQSLTSPAGNPEFWFTPTGANSWQLMAQRSDSNFHVRNSVGQGFTFGASPSGCDICIGDGNADEWARLLFRTNTGGGLTGALYQDASDSPFTSGGILHLSNLLPTSIEIDIASGNKWRFNSDGGFNASGLVSQGAGKINCNGIYVLGVPHDYVLEKWSTGVIDKTANEFSKSYSRLSIEDAENFVRSNFKLPALSSDQVELGERIGSLTVALEEAYTYIFELKRDLDALKNKA